MPCIEIATNITKEKVTNDVILNLSRELTAAIGKPEQLASLPGEPENFVSVRILPDQLMSFGGSLEPCGLANLISIGNMGVEENKVLAGKIYSFIEKYLGILNDRMYIIFIDKLASDVGYKGTTYHQLLGN